jgi:YfiH family protein
MTEWLPFHSFDGHPVTAALSLRGKDAREDWEELARELGYSRVAQLTQVHGKRVIRVAAQACLPFEEADAMVTDVPGLLLMVRVADCAAISLYDPERKAIGLVHAGWRGLVAGIVGEAVGAMRKECGTRPESLIAAVSPSLGPCCSEFSRPEEEIPSEFHSFIRDGRKVDLWGLIEGVLARSGIHAANVEFVRECTRCGKEQFYSHRRGDEKRMGAFLGLNDPLQK